MGVADDVTPCQGAASSEGQVQCGTRDDGKVRRQRFCHPHLRCSTDQTPFGDPVSKMQKKLDKTGDSRSKSLSAQATLLLGNSTAEDGTEQSNRWSGTQCRYLSTGRSLVSRTVKVAGGSPLQQARHKNRGLDKGPEASRQACPDLWKSGQ